MKKRIVLFDIDLTIFDTDKFKRLKDLEVMKLMGVKDSNKYFQIKHNYEQRLQNPRDFDPKEFIEIVSREFEIDNYQDIIQNTYKNMEIYLQCLYEDTELVFNKLKSKYTFGVYTEGIDPEFQKMKIKATGIDKYFTNDLIFIVEAKDTKEVINKIPKGSIIVDDKETICQFLINNGFRAIWINRKDKRKSDKYETIYSLIELPAIL